MEEEVVKSPLDLARELLANENATYEQVYQTFRRLLPRHPMVRTMAIERKGSREHLIYQMAKRVENADKAAAFDAAREERKAAKAAEADAVVIDMTTGTRGLEEGGEEEPTTEDELAALKERSRLIAERAKLQNTLADQTTDEGRKAVVDQMDALTAQIEDLTKTVDAAAEFPIPDTLEGVKDALNLSRIRKSKHEKFLVDRPEDKLVPKWEQKVAYETAYIQKLIEARDAYGQ